MNIEELKLILEAVKTVSGDASNVAIIWLSFELLKFIVGWGAFASGMWFVFKACFNTHKANMAVEQINQILGKPGSSWVYLPSEYMAVVDAVRKLKQAQDSTP